MRGWIYTGGGGARLYNITAGEQQLPSKQQGIRHPKGTEWPERPPKKAFLFILLFYLVVHSFLFFGRKLGRREWKKLTRGRDGMKNRQ
ncbi:MAG: hypothetical protein DI548_02900 [Flavobacterium johnsoniae]|nr:MAG: hypothetical protein DI548_02900 [Flavobacterium johnsoniae]